MSPVGSHVLKLSLWLVELFWKVMRALGCGALAGRNRPLGADLLGPSSICLLPLSFLGTLTPSPCDHVVCGPSLLHHEDGSIES